MDNNTVNGIQRQLRQLLQGLEGADDLTAAKQLTETSAALLRLLKKLDVDIGALTEDDYEDMAASYMGISQAVSSFAGQIHDRDVAQAERLVQTGGVETLTQAQQKGKKLRADAVQLAKDLDQQTAANEALQKNLDAKKLNYADRCSEYQRLKDELDSFYPSKYDQQLADNKELKEKLDSLKEKLNQTEKQHETLTVQLNEENAHLSRLERELESLPADIRQLGDTCVEKERYLDRLRNAQQEFGLERQKEVQDEIDALEPEVEGLEKAIQALKNTLNNLKQTHTGLNREKQHLETDLLERINAGLEELNNFSLEHREALDEVSRQADTLEEGLKKCEELRRRYAAWWDADRTPLEIIQGILGCGDPLDEELSSNLNPAKSRRLSDLNSRIKTALEEMDNILGLCFQAMQQDQGAVSGKVSRIPRG